MKIKQWAIPILFFLVSFPNILIQAQEISENENIQAVHSTGFYLGGQASTNGLGFNLRYMAGKKLTLKTGIESLNLWRNFEFDESDISYNAELNYKTGGIFFLADFFYARSLYLSGGLILNNFQPKLEGVASSDFQYGDIIIPASDVGDFSIHFEPGLKVSPYIGAGIRHFFGKSQSVNFTFETGLYYMGPPQVKIETTGLLAPTSDPDHGQQLLLEDQFSTYKFYPVVKLALAIRLF